MKQRTSISKVDELRNEITQKLIKSARAIPGGKRPILKDYECWVNNEYHSFNKVTLKGLETYDKRVFKYPEFMLEDLAEIEDIVNEVKPK